MGFLTKRTGDGDLPRLYAIVDEAVTARAARDPIEIAAAFFRGGVRWLQLRAKATDSATLLAHAEAMARLARDFGASFVVNDRADVARLAGAGVHVGQDDLPVRHVRAIVGEAACVGLSTHTLDQVERGLREPVTYLAVGPVYATATKDTGYEAVGLGLVREAAARAGARVPIVAIGGITLDRAPAVLAAGASAVAVIGDLLLGDPESRARTWVRTLESEAKPSGGGSRS